MVNPKGKSLDALVEETQRTTHAVRAIARVLLLQLSYSALIAGFLGVVTLIFGVPGLASTFVIITLVCIAVVALIHSLLVGWGELILSRRPDYPQNLVKMWLGFETNEKSG